MESKKKHLKRVLIFVLGVGIIIYVYLTCSTGRPSAYYVAYPGNYKFIMDDTPTCRTRTPFLVLMVPVAPGNTADRDAIRQTWGSEKLVLGQPVETLFILGLPGGADAEQQQEKLRRENQEHHDLIQSNFQDSYNNLTIKTMVMLEWLHAHCTSASYVIKVDSDILLHTENLVKLLVDPRTPKQNFMTGLVWWHSPVLRNPLLKFFMPRYVIAEPEYPPYPLGMAYVMSLDLPGKILSVSLQIQPIYIEDAYLGMCLKRLNISPTDPPEATMFIVKPQHPLSSCSLSNVIAVTTTSIQQMTSYWKKSREPEGGCLTSSATSRRSSAPLDVKIN
ncbi:beta-1,3-galactosyltransferase 2-like isoform X1 [Echeneis naucrates]|uniref:beta-1,3-galactosyltransferase 2-like isoform X1 n=1 Tax=Echeneis naucrates TaxID=173247 RepID=UPI0011139F1C|nr:beta-1,3-galactosyltransferase 2-like isoform X1 [Echeneis naucrates]XP_029362100.1 beta-1,3-galactosyltransferase 2-like isoform X1 [Echeneis naucrates]